MDDGMFLEQHVPLGVLNGIKFDVLTESHIEKYSVMAIDTVTEVTDPKLGVPNPSSQCSTCSATDVKSCDGHMGIIKFPMDILHPYFIAETVQILNSICPGCRSARQNLRIKGADTISKTSTTKGNPSKGGCKYCVANSKEWYPAMRFKVAWKDLIRRNASIVVEVNEKLPKKFLNKNLSEVLSRDYWDFIPKDPQQESFLKWNQRTLSPAQVYYLLKDIDLSFIGKFVSRPESLFLSCFPVTPNCHRVMETMHVFSNGHKLIFDERTKAYRGLVDFKGQANVLALRVRECLNVSKLHSEKSLNRHSASSKSGLKWIKEVILGKRSDYAFRMTVIGDPNIALCEIGIPRDISESLLISEYLNSRNWEKLNICCNLRLLEKGEFYVRRKGNLVRLHHMDELQIGDITYRPLGEGDVVLINRPPSVHQHSLLALSVKVLPINSVISINPLCCSPLQGDFDGDCLHGYIPQSINSRIELKELVSLNQQLINGQNGRNLLSLSHDSLTAAYLVREKGVLLNKFQMQQLEMLCPRQLQWPAILKAPLLNSPVWTGKQLFSLLLPQCFDFVFPSNGVEIRGGELLSSSDESAWLRDTDGNIFSSLVECYPSKALDILFAAQEVFCEWISMRGFSVSLSDLYISSGSYLRKLMVDEVSCALQEAELICQNKQWVVDPEMEDFLKNGKVNQNFKEHKYHPNQKSAALNQVAIGAFREVFYDIQNLIHQYASRDNSLLAMVKAGSKGNLVKLVQQGLCLGLQHSLVSSNVPYSVVENSFLSGLNPQENFVHSVACRNMSFGENADLPGTLTRKLMFYMRDLYRAYDGTVRSAYGNQLVQFNYGILKDSSFQDNNGLVSEHTYALDGFGGQPVGSLAACSISEAAYSALDQPMSALETSPLQKLKKVLECGQKATTGDQTISLFLSNKLRRWLYGFEYGAIEVKHHLERVLFSDVVSTATIVFSPQEHRRIHFSQWVCHFHISEEALKRRRLNIQSVVVALNRNYKSTAKQANIKFPSLQIISWDGWVADGQKENVGTFCITVTVEIAKGSLVKLDTVRDLVIPVLLRTVIKGFLEFKNVDILWSKLPDEFRFHRSSGELYLRVSMSDDCERAKFWCALQNACLPIMDLIDWERSHPDNIYDICCAYGIDTAWTYFLRSLKFALSDIGKTVLLEHLLLIADSLSFSGEFSGLSTKGIKRQRDLTSVSSPFMQACFSNPGSCFIKAAKDGARDDLHGTLESVAWGKEAPIGTGGHFDILYSGKGHKLDKPEDIYRIMCSQLRSQEEKVEIMVSDPHQNTELISIQQRFIPPSNAHRNKSYKWDAQSMCDPTPKGHKSLECILNSVLRSFYSADDILKMNISLKNILHRYPINHYLNEADKTILMKALFFHPKRDEKMGCGPQDIKVGYHSLHQQSRCFMVVRTDGTVEDFSYHKCILGALQKISPQQATRYQKRMLQLR